MRSEGEADRSRTAQEGKDGEGGGGGTGEDAAASVVSDVSVCLARWGWTDVSVRQDKQVCRGGPSWPCQRYTIIRRCGRSRVRHYVSLGPV